MAVANSSIQWTDATWSPLRGCSLVSAGCQNCYAMRQAHRFSSGAYEGLTKMTSHGPVWTGDVRLVPEMLEVPLHWRKPRRIFVASMSDPFHERVPDSFLDEMFAVMSMTPQHTYQLLTKRPDRMREYMSGSAHGATREVALIPGWPPPNVHLGVSVENQKSAEERIPELLRTPAAVRFVSCEPLLSPIDFNALSDQEWNLNALSGLRENPFGDVVEREYGPKLDWCIVGGESGPRARPFDLAWARSLKQQCRAADVAYFFKQAGAQPFLDGNPLVLRDRKGGDLAELPEDLRVREYPDVLKRGQADDLAALSD